MMNYDYDIDRQPIHKSLEKVSIADALNLGDPSYFNRTLCEVNDTAVRISVFKRDFHWHSHENEDEFFFVLEGELELEVEGHEPFVLKPREGVVVPRGVRHRPKSPQGVVLLMVEPSSVISTGN
jgi:mannose-6-phosphate isomerase-like protein (cupin superfamily)